MATAKVVSAQLIFTANGKASTWTIQIACRRLRSTDRSRISRKALFADYEKQVYVLGSTDLVILWARHELKSCGKTRESRFLTAKAVRNDKIWGLATRVTRALFVRFQARVFRSLKGVPLN